MTTRSIQHRVQIQQKFPPNNLHSKPEPSVKLDASIKSEPDEDKNEMKDDEEDEILASPQASQGNFTCETQAIFALFNLLLYDFSFSSSPFWGRSCPNSEF